MCSQFILLRENCPRSFRLKDWMTSIKSENENALFFCVKPHIWPWLGKMGITFKSYNSFIIECSMLSGVTVDASDSML